MNRDNHDKAMLKALQDIARELKRMNSKKEFEVCKTEHDGCEDCMYYDKECTEEPCNKCKYNHQDYFRYKTKIEC